MMKKFVRQPKAQPRPSPVMQFDEYAAGTAPLDVYRKHYMVFGYWNAELLDSLLPTARNPKRTKRASQESLRHFEQMVELLGEPFNAHAKPLLEERRKLDRQLQDAVDDNAQAALLRQRVELQQRRIHRLMAVGKVTEHLQSSPPSAAHAAAQKAVEPSATPTDAQ